MLSDVHAIAFDLDNTLWDVEPVLERAEERLAAWLRQHCPRITLSRAEMRAAREQLARREPHNAHDVSYLRISTLAAHAREYGYDEGIAAEAFEVFLAARNEVQIFPDVAPALARLRRRYPLASLSNGNADLARIGLEHVFAVSLNARRSVPPSRTCAASSGWRRSCCFLPTRSPTSATIRSSMWRPRARRGCARCG